MIIKERYIDYGKTNSIKIVEANYLGDFAIRLIFNDSHYQLVDFKPFLENSSHPQIKSYLKEDKFTSFQIIDGNLEWGNGELIFPIQDLYDNTILKSDSIRTTQ